MPIRKAVHKTKTVRRTQKKAKVGPSARRVNGTAFLQWGQGSHGARTNDVNIVVKS